MEGILKTMHLFLEKRIQPLTLVLIVLTLVTNGSLFALRAFVSPSESAQSYVPGFLTAFIRESHSSVQRISRSRVLDPEGALESFDTLRTFRGSQNQGSSLGAEHFFASPPESTSFIMDFVYEKGNSLTIHVGTDSRIVLGPVWNEQDLVLNLPAGIFSFQGGDRAP